MAKSRDNMVASAKKLAGMEASTFISDADWAEYVTRGVEDLWEKLLDVKGAENFMKSDTIVTVANTDEYNLDSTFFQLINILTAYNTGVLRSLEKFEWADEASLRNLQDSGFPRYRIIGSATQGGQAKIMFLPVPRSVYTIYYKYVGKPVFASGSDTIEGINGWEEYAELVAAIKALNKEESDPSGLIMDLNRVTERIHRHKSSKDRVRPPKIQDTRRDRWRTFSYFRDKDYDF